MIVEETEAEILMHRDAHFGGSFSLMLDYYRLGKKGVQKEFEIKQIEELQLLEKEREENLAPILLSAADAEAIADARKAYQALSHIYEKEDPDNTLPKIIADLILTEDTEAIKEIAALVNYGKEAVPALLELLRSPKYYNPLYPGYGKAPINAAKCLGEIGDKRAIISLFESIGTGDLFDEEVVLKALKLIGPPAKEFLLNILKSKPYNEDNERAAIALIAFNNDPQVPNACLALLQNPETHTHTPLATYLILCCETLADKEPLKALADTPKFPQHLKEEIHTL